VAAEAGSISQSIRKRFQPYGYLGPFAPAFVWPQLGFRIRPLALVTGGSVTNEAKTNPNESQFRIDNDPRTMQAINQTQFT